jgi:hypothetical protein
LAEDGPFEDVAMAVDADRNAHLVGASVTGATQNGIVYMTDSSGRWIPEGLTNQVEGVDAQDHDGDVAIAVDPDGTVWVAFTRFGQGDSLQAPALQTFVMRNINGTWSAPVVVAGAGSNSVSMAARGGVLHLAYVVGQPLDASPQQVYYANNSTGAWEAQLISDDGSAPQLRLGADGLPRIAYGTPDGVRLVVMGTDGPEPDLPPGPSAGGADSVLLDVRGDNEYLVWRDIETSVYFHTSRTPIGWTATTAVPVGDVIPDAMVVDGVDESSMQIAGRSEPGGALYVFGVAGPAGSAPLIEGDADDSDLVLSGGGLHVVYAYSGTAQTAGIWFLSHNTE